MAATPSIVVKKSTAYKGGTRVWSNRYHFSGGTPANSTAWTNFSDAVVNAEKLALTAQTTIVETIGYAAGSDVGVHEDLHDGREHQCDRSYHTTPRRRSAR